MAVIVHSAPLRRRHFAPGFCTFASLLNVCSWLVVVIVPFVLAFTSGAFWRKQAIHYEQPNVHFRHKVLFYLNGIETSLDGQESTLTLAYSNLKQANEVLQGSATLRAPSLRSVVSDANDDGLMDEHELDIHFPLRSGEKITHVTALLWYDYVLQDQVKEAFESLVYVEASSGSAPAAALEAYGTIALVQVRRV